MNLNQYCTILDEKGEKVFVKTVRHFERLIDTVLDHSAIDVPWAYAQPRERRFVHLEHEARSGGLHSAVQ